MKTMAARLTAPFTSGGGFYGRLYLWRYEHPVLFFAACMLIATVVVLAAAAFVTPALANETEDGIASMAPWEWGNQMINSAFNLINVNTDYLKQSFDAALGKDSGAFGFIRSVNDTVMKPIAVSILAIVFLVEVAKLANDFEAHGALPPLKNVIFMWICCAVCIFLLNKSFDFCQNIFDMFNALISSTFGIGTEGSDFLNTSGSSSGQTFTYTDEYGNQLTLSEEMVKTINTFAPTDFLPKLLLGLVLYIECAIVSIVTYFSLIARALQTYVYAAVSPIMLAFLGSEKTQSWAISFIKSFIALCLAGLIMAICIKIMPLAATGIAKSMGGGIVGFFMIVATFGVYIKAMASAGSWAKEILGG